MPFRALCLALALAASSFAMQPIRYTVRFPEPETHALEVEAVFPAAGADVIAHHPTDLLAHIV